MQKEVALVKVNDNKLHKIFIKIKKIFSKFIKKENEVVVEEEAYIPTIEVAELEEAKSMEDFEYLKGIIEGKIQIKDLDQDLKKRLISLCNERLVEVNNEIAKKERQIKKAKEILKKVNDM